MKSKTALLLLLPILLSACDGGSAEKNANPLHLPPQGFVGDPVQGRAIYSQNCLGCHGNNGLGSNQGPPLVHKIYEPNHHADLSFHLAVSTGVRAHHWHFGDMQPLPHLSPKDVEHIVQYIRGLQRKAGIQ